MRAKKLLQLGSAFLLSLSSVLAIGVPAASAATVYTWSGGGSDGLWSNPNNWLGAAAPQPSAIGDSVVINNAANFSHGSKDDVPGLSLVSLSFTGDAPSSNTESITLLQNLTITSAISQDSTDTSTVDFIQNDAATNATLTIGGNVTVSSSAGYEIDSDTSGGGSMTILLATQTLTFTEATTAGSTTEIGAKISGGGTVVYNAPHSEFQIAGDNDYTGATHVIDVNTNGVYQTDNQNYDPFGTSVVTIETGSSVTLDGYTADTTVPNQFIINGVSDNSVVTSMSFGDNNTAPVTLTVPAITLNGNTKFGNNSNTATNGLTVNMNGITTNGHCAEFLGSSTTVTDGPANGFTNGPAGCVVQDNTTIVSGGGPTVVAPNTPDTGFALVSANIVPVLATTIAAAGGLLYAARRARPIKR